MNNDQTNNRADPTKTKAQDVTAATAAQPCESGAPKKKKLSLDIEEIGEVLERKISP
jgi:hypothetical protein